MQEEYKDPHVIDEDDLKDDNNYNQRKHKCKLIHQCIKCMAAMVHLARPWLFRISQKPNLFNLIIVLLYTVLKKIKTIKHTVTRLLLEIMH